MKSDSVLGKQMSRVTGMDSAYPGQERALWFMFFSPLSSHPCPNHNLVTVKGFFLGSVYHLLQTPTYTFTGRKVLLKSCSHHIILLLTNPASIFLPESEPVFGITVVSEPTSPFFSFLCMLYHPPLASAKPISLTGPLLPLLCHESSYHHKTSFPPHGFKATTSCKTQLTTFRKHSKIAI